MIDLVLGTRPEIIKLAPVASALRAARRKFRIVHTGQHYSYEMDRIFFEELGVTKPEVFLEVGSGTHGAQTGKMVERLEATFMEKRPDLVLVQGDTNTVLAGTLAASKLHIPVGHVEAGLRCFDRSLVEEQNRVVADRLATLHFAPTRVSKANLAREGIRGRWVRVTGNTIVDAVRGFLPSARKRWPRARSVTGSSKLEERGFVLATLHRQGNVDKPANLRRLLAALDRVSTALDLPVVLPVHPRTRARMEKSRVRLGPGVIGVPPLGYLDFVALLDRAALVLTDSGGVQEEACVLQVPCVTLRESTERPETVTVGANVVSGTGPERIVRAARKMAHRPRRWRNPFGDGRAGERIAQSCGEFLEIR